MNEQELISHIEELGLSNKEARVYVACLKTGPSAVQHIADQSGIKRVTTYVILESLVGMGMVSQSIKGKKTFFVAEEPSNLQRIIEKNELQVKRQKVSLDKVLPQLLGLKTIPKELPEVKFYDGADGVRSLFATFFAQYSGPSRQIYAFSNLDQVHAFLPERVSGEPNPDRVKSGTTSKLIYTSNRGPILKNGDKDFNRVSRFVPEDAYPVTGDINIIGDYVILISFSDNRPISVSIRNHDMAEAMKAVFNMAWETAAAFNE